MMLSKASVLISGGVSLIIGNMMDMSSRDVSGGDIIFKGKYSRDN